MSLSKEYVKRATLLDLPKIYAFYKEINNHPQIIKYYRRTMGRTLLKQMLFLKTLFMNLLTQKEIFVIMIANAKVKGVCHITIERRNGTFVGTYGIVTLEEYQGRHIGKILSMCAINEARKLGVKTIKLTVDADNFRAISLYRKLGFYVTKFMLKHGRRFSNEIVDMYEMEKNLS
jgi:ribosomal protein S18 acetylase RimI-like enzyme